MIGGKERPVRLIDQETSVPVGAGYSGAVAISTTVAGGGVGTDAQTLQGHSPATLATPYAIPVLDQAGYLPAGMLPPTQSGQQNFAGGVGADHFYVYRAGSGKYDGAASGPWILGIDVWAGGQAKTGMKYEALGAAGTDYATTSNLLELWTGNAPSGGGDLQRFAVRWDGTVTGLSFNGLTGLATTEDNQGLGDAPTVGTSTLAARQDHHHGIPRGTPSALPLGGGNVAGSQIQFAGADHLHGLATGTPSGLTVGAATADGSSTALPHLDHVHGVPTGIPGGLTVGGAAAAGTSTAFPHLDHVHATPVGTPASPSVNLAASSAGASGNFADSGHTHQLDQSIVPAWNGLHTFNAGLNVPANQRIKVGEAYLSSPVGSVNLAGHAWQSGTGWTADGTPGALMQLVGQDTYWFKHNGVGTPTFTQLAHLDPNGIFSGQGLSLGNGTLPTAGQIIARGAGNKLRLEYDALNYAEWSVGSSGDLTVSPWGDFVFNPQGGGDQTSRDVYPELNWTMNLGLLNKKWLTIHAAELWVETLVAQDTISTIGGRIIVGPTTTLTRDWSPDTASTTNTWTESGGGFTASGALLTPPDAATNKQYLITYTVSALPAGATASLYVTDGTTVTLVQSVNATGTYSVSRRLSGSQYSFYFQGNTNGAYTVSAVAVSQTAFVKHNQMQINDIAMMETQGKIEFLQVAGGPSANQGTAAKPEYYYDVTRNLDGTGANQWYAGDALANTGTTGSGFIDLYSLESVNGARLDYIYNVAGNGTTGSNHANDSTWILYGDVSGPDPFAAFLYFGLAGGIWSNLFFNLTVAATGFTSGIWEYWNGTVWTAFTPDSNTTALFQTTGLVGVTWNAAGLTGWASTAPGTLPSAYWVRWHVTGFTGIPTGATQAGRRVYRFKAQWGPTIVGWIRNSQTFSDITEHWAIGNLNGLYGYASNTWGVGLGKNALTSPHVTIDATAIKLYNYLPTSLVNAELMRIGKLDGSWGYGNGGSYGIALGPDLNSKPYILLDADVGITLGWRDAGGVRQSRFKLDVFGDLNIFNSSGTPVITLDHTGASYFAGPMTIGAGGGIWQGSSGTFAAPGTGLKIWNQANVGRIAGYNAGTVQWYADTDGIFKAGAGNVQLSANGINLEPGTITTSQITWQHVGDPSPVGMVYADRGDGIASGQVYLQRKRPDGTIPIGLFLNEAPVPLNTAAAQLQLNTVNLIFREYNTADYPLISYRSSPGVGNSGVYFPGGANGGIVALSGVGATVASFSATSSQFFSDTLLGSNVGQAIRFKTVTVVNPGTIQLPYVTGSAAGTKGFCFVSGSNGADHAIFVLGGGLTTTFLVADPQSGYSVTAGTANKTNVYWSAANSRYELQNNTNVLQTYNILFIIDN